MKGVILVTADDALRQEVESTFAGMGLACSSEMPLGRAPEWALVADIGMLAPLAASLPNQDLPRHFGQVVALSSEGGFHARLQAVRLGASGFLERPMTALDILDLIDDCDPAEPIRVLVVDDDPIAARVTARQLEMAGMRVSALEDAARALDVLAELQPDIAVLDLYMPVCSGTELALVIRQLAGYESLPIVFLSSEGELAAQMNAVSLGGDDFVAKGTPAALMIPLIRSRAARMRRLRRHLRKLKDIL